MYIQWKVYLKRISLLLLFARRRRRRRKRSTFTIKKNLKCNQSESNIVFKMALHKIFDTASLQSRSLLLLLSLFRFKLIQLSQCHSFAFRLCFCSYSLVAHSLHYIYTSTYIHKLASRKDANNHEKLDLYGIEMCLVKKPIQYSKLNRVLSLNLTSFTPNIYYTERMISFFLFFKLYMMQIRRRK